jgi:hypothetical protein
MSISDNGLTRFMASPLGRTTRIVVGAVLLAWGLTAGTPLGWIMAAIGLVPLSAGVLDFCYVSALLGGPLKGRAIRDQALLP